MQTELREYLENIKFGRQLEQLAAGLNGKKVVLYGIGELFHEIYNTYNLNCLNIIGIADKKYTGHDQNEQVLGWNIYSQDEIKDLNPDYILVAAKCYIEIIEELYKNVVKSAKIKLKPLAKKPLLQLLQEIWCW